MTNRKSDSAGKSPIQVIPDIPKIVRILEIQFGIPVWHRKNPLDELILTILSQNTNDRNRDRAYQALRREFPHWEQVESAPMTEIEAAIRTAGLSAQKSARIKAILGWIRAYFGSLSLEALHSLNDDQAISLLTTQKGIGIKTAAVMLAFSLDRDLCPVDTHVHRIAIRLGWVLPGTNAEKTFSILRPLIPVGSAPTFHLNLLKFGRTICTARNPKCRKCCLREECIFPHKSLE